MRVKKECVTHTTESNRSQYEARPVGSFHPVTALGLRTPSLRLLSQISGFVSFPKQGKEVLQSWVGPVSGEVCGLGLALVGGSPNLHSSMAHALQPPKI